MKLALRVKRDEVMEKGLVRVPYPPYDIVVVVADGEIFALEDACNHAGASLSEGWVENKCIVCPMHGYVFDLRTGDLLRPRGLCSAQRTFRAVVEGDEIAIYDPFHLAIVTG